MAGLPDHKFDVSIFDQVGTDRVSINGGMTLRVGNIQVCGYPYLDKATGITHPIYFEVTGLKYHYVVSAGSDKVEIKVCTVVFDRVLGFNRYVAESFCLPRNQAELLEAIETIAGDFEDLLDARAVA